MVVPGRERAVTLDVTNSSSPLSLTFIHTLTKLSLYDPQYCHHVNKTIYAAPVVGVMGYQDGKFQQKFPVKAA